MYGSTMGDKLLDVPVGYGNTWPGPAELDQVVGKGRLSQTYVLATVHGL